MLDNERVTNFSHPSGPAFVRQLNGVEVERVTPTSFTIAQRLSLSVNAFPTGTGQKLAAWSPSGAAVAATGISVVASGQALQFDGQPGTNGGLRFPNGGINNYMLGARYADGTAVGLYALLSDNATRSGDDALVGNYQKVAAGGFQSFQFNNIESWNLAATTLSSRGNDIAGVRRLNNEDGKKSFGNLSAASSTGTVAVNAGSGTVFHITASAGQLLAMQPSAIDKDLVLLQNRSSATHTIFSAGTPSQAIGQLNPSGVAWVRFSAASGGWEMQGRTQMGLGF